LATTKIIEIREILAKTLIFFSIEKTEILNPAEDLFANLNPTNHLSL
jgi:hypothetical protein